MKPRKKYATGIRLETGHCGVDRKERERERETLK
jgi:hypothetical protein